LGATPAVVGEFFGFSRIHPSSPTRTSILVQRITIICPPFATVRSTVRILAGLYCSTASKPKYAIATKIAELKILPMVGMLSSIGGIDT
jgi:hypothetical protein